MELYHYCPVPLENGSVITPGNWGRIIRQYPMPDNCNAIVVRELLLENIRLHLYPSYPSRLDCAYVCIGEESAKEFKSRRKLHFCYHVDLVSPSMPSFQGSWKHFEMPPESLEDWHRAAEKYWSTNWATESPNTLELLTMSSIRILGKVSL